MAHDQRIAIGGCLGDEVGGDGPGRDGVVLHEHWLAASLLELAAVSAREQIDEAARRSPNQNANGLVGIILRVPRLCRAYQRKRCER